jgi:uncharacterized protein YbbK (DUF523 family)
MPPIIVSACLLGVKCRYDGSGKACQEALELARKGLAVPICPEQLGGLPTPREAAENKDGRVVTISGNDQTEVFERGAQEAVRIAEVVGAKEALLKSRSPSCGCGQIYDGMFSGRLVEGDGVTAAALKRAGLAVRNERE